MRLIGLLALGVKTMLILLMTYAIFYIPLDWFTMKIGKKMPWYVPFIPAFLIWQLAGYAARVAAQ